MAAKVGHFRMVISGLEPLSTANSPSSPSERLSRRLVEYINKVQPNLSNKFHKRTLRDKWLSKFEKERRPGTVKSYLGALNQFYIFLKCERPPQIDAAPEMLSCLSAQMKLWSKSFRKLNKDRFWEKKTR